MAVRVCANAHHRDVAQRNRDGVQRLQSAVKHDLLMRRQFIRRCVRHLLILLYMRII